MTGLGNVPSEVMERLRKRESCRIGVVGASNNPRKFGNIIVRNLLGKGFSVVPIHPVEKQVEGLTCYASILDVPGKLDIVDFVVPPAAALGVLEQMSGLPHDAVWFQDGSFDDAVLTRAAELFPLVVSHACIMVVTNFS